MDALGMKNEHLTALLDLAGTEKDGSWQVLKDERTMTLQAACSGVGFGVSKIRKVRSEGALLYAENATGEVTVLSLEDVFAGSVDAASKASRKAGFR